MRTRASRFVLTLVVLAAMALSTGAGIRWGVSSMVTPPPDDPGMEMMVDSGEGA